MTTKTSLRSIARLLLLIGGIILILEAVLQIGVDLRGLLDFTPRVPSLDIFTSAIVSVLVGIIALVAAGTSPQPRLEHHPADLRIPVNWKPWWYTGLYRRLNCTSRDVCLNVHS